jgi:hypothetical protein
VEEHREPLPPPRSFCVERMIRERGSASRSIDDRVVAGGADREVGAGGLHRARIEIIQTA